MSGKSGLIFIMDPFSHACLQELEDTTLKIKCLNILVKDISLLSQEIILSQILKSSLREISIGDFITAHNN